MAYLSLFESLIILPKCDDDKWVLIIYLASLPDIGSLRIMFYDERIEYYRGSSLRELPSLTFVIELRY